MKIWLVQCNNGDGSSSIHWVKDEKVLQELHGLADEGDEAWASGDGLLVTSLVFPEEFALEAFIKQNHLYWLEEV